ncbi:MAG: lipid-A-disaccharide synthase, partial [Planctomycetota bacterium]
VGLLPGSRRGEIERNWPVMLDVVRRVAARHDDVTFTVACYSETIRDRCGELLEERGADLPISLRLGETPEVIAAADCCLSVSGSVSLELLARATPSVMMYRVDKLFGFLGRRLITCRYMSLPNLVAGEEVLPEYPSDGSPAAHAEAIAAGLDDWLSHPAKLAASRDRLAALAETVAVGGATAKVCDAIEDELTLETGTRRAA